MNRIKFLTNDSLQHVADFIGCSFQISESHGAFDGWRYITVLDSRDLLIGKLIYSHGELVNVKCYKPDHYRSLVECDWIWFKLMKFIRDGSLIDQESCDRCQRIALILKDLDLDKKISYRAKNPLFDKSGKAKKRKALQGKNIRLIIKDLILNY